MQTVMIAGRVVRDAEMRFTQSGQQLLSFTVVTNVYNNGEYESTFFRCTLWGKRAEALSDKIRKGMEVAVTGSLRVGLYTPEGGEPRLNADVNVAELFLTKSATEAVAEAVSEENDLPF